MHFVQQALKSQFGDIGTYFVTLCIFLFAFSSIVGNFYYAEANIKFITESKTVMNIFKCICIIIVFAGALVNMDVAWSIADIIMASMATINIIAIFLLRKPALNALDDYRRKKKSGIDPTFLGSDIGLDDIECWQKNK